MTPTPWPDFWTGLAQIVVTALVLSVVVVGGAWAVMRLIRHTEDD